MVRSSTRGNGNSAKDDAWIAWMKEHGDLKPIDPDEEGVPWPAMSQWSGDSEDEGNPWMAPPPNHERRCVGKAYVRDPDGNYIMDKNKQRIMRPCWNWAMKGAKVCVKHGGGVERVRRGAMERLVSALDATTGELIKMALSDDVEDKVKVQAINSILDRAGVKGGIEVDVKVPGWQDAIRKMFDSEAAVE